MRVKKIALTAAKKLSGYRGRVIMASVITLAMSTLGAHEGATHTKLGHTSQALAARANLLRQGEEFLADNQLTQASQAFEQAALLSHDPEIELGILRTQMQAGAYRHALAFAAHTAGIHLDDIRGALFYAWLLDRGSQTTLAQRLLERLPTHATPRTLQSLQQLLKKPATAVPVGPLLQAPLRLAPYASGANTPPNAATAASALLWADGQHAIAPLPALASHNAIWLRNGLGQTVRAHLIRSESDIGLALLKLDQPLPIHADEICAAKEGFAGAASYALDYPLDAQGQPAWPMMRAGFLGPLPPTNSPHTLARPLGIELGAQGPRGGPVYDVGGRLLGIALATPAGTDQLVSIRQLRQHFGELLGPAASVQPATPISADEIYERAMKTSLQVLVTHE